MATHGDLAGEDRALSRHVGGAVLRLARRLRAENDCSLSLATMSLLGRLYHGGALPAGELAVLENIGSSEVSSLLGQLEEQGLVQRQAQAVDRRGVIVELTALGHSRIEQDPSFHGRWLDRHLEDLTSEERRTLCWAADLFERWSRAETLEAPVRRQHRSEP